jgi:hypothetical protein
MPFSKRSRLRAAASAFILVPLGALAFPETPSHAEPIQIKTVPLQTETVSAVVPVADPPPSEPPLATPPPPAPRSEPSDANFDRLARCESGGRWNLDTGNGYYGGLQFGPITWANFGGQQYASNAHLASRAQQIAVARRVQAARGWRPWPTCSRRLALH